MLKRRIVFYGIGCFHFCIIFGLDCREPITEPTEAELKKIALCSISATFLDSKGREKIFDMVDIF